MFQTNPATAETPSATPVSISQLPDPETLIEEDLPEESPAFQSSSGGLAGATVRALKGIPPCVWVLNRHSKAISVVVSQFKPTRLLTKGDVNASATGAGLGFEAQVYNNPATTKSVAPGKSARFPLWSKLNDYGVITIIKGDEEAEAGEAGIKNDWIPAGATAVYTATEDLKLYDFKGKPIRGLEAVVLDE